MKANDRQVGGTHYSAGTQHWDYAIRILKNRYLEGNITKYVARSRKKNGAKDLEKALHYTQKLIECMYKLSGGPFTTNAEFIQKFCTDNDLLPLEASIMQAVPVWQGSHDLLRIKKDIETLLVDAVKEDTKRQAVKAGALRPLDV